MSDSNHHDDCEIVRTDTEMCTLKERDNAQRRLCWYCGEYGTRFAWGLSIGEIVYSSDIHVSEELANDMPERLAETEYREAQWANKCVMCYECVRRFASVIGMLDAEYVEGQLFNRDQQDMEIADTDTHLLPWQEKKFPFGCWLDSFPDIGVRRKFSSLSGAQLYVRGFRFAGEVWFGNWEANQLLTRFGATGERVEVPVGFVEHVAAAIHVDDLSFPLRLAGLRAVAFDVSIFLAARGGLQQETQKGT